MADESEDIAPPVKYTSLKKFVKNEKDMRAGGDAIDELIGELEFIAIAIWKRASEYAESDGRSTVKQRDVQKAYDELFRPHDLLMEVAERVEEMGQELENEAKQSPAFPELEKDGE